MSKHAAPLRQAWVAGLRVEVLTQIENYPTIAGKVTYVAPSDAFATIGDVDVPLDRIIRVFVKQPKKTLPR